MILEFIHSDNSRESINLNLDVPIKNEWINISSKSKLDFIKEFLPAYKSGQKIVLFDSNHKQLLEFHKQNNINDLDSVDKVNDTCQLLFFTSGSSGFPVGAFKSKENLEQELKVLKGLVENYKIKQVIVSVPFVHIYGVLAGLLLPLYLDGVKLIVKDDFLPYEILEEASSNNSLIITTPVFIKALSKINDSKSLTSGLFISSTGPLHIDDVTLFESKFETNLMQLFGSTETGGIAYKFGSSNIWKAMQGVNVSTNEEKLSVSSAFISPYIFSEKITKLEQPFISEDIIELDDDGFILIGRSNKIIKIAGKRISALQIESILEMIDGVEKVIIELVYKKELLRSEQIMITMQSSCKIDKQTIKKRIKKYYGVLTIPFNVKYVDKIDHSAMGKKIIFTTKYST